MKKSEQQRGAQKKSADIKKKPYQQPKILSVEKLEVIAATCDGSKAVFDGVSNCGKVSRLNS